jgi:SOS-response transcriptional repressor LexA
MPESGTLCAVMVDNKILIRKYFIEDDTVILVPESTDESYVSKKYKSDKVTPIGIIIKAVINIQDF